MAKDSKKKVPPSRNRLARSERERRMNRIIMIVTTTIVVLAVVAVIAAVIAGIAETNQVIAVVGEDRIRVKDFIPRVEYQRYLLLNQFETYYNYVITFDGYPDLQTTYINQMATIEFQMEPYTLGLETINTMVDELIIRQEAEKRGIFVTEEEIEDELQMAFGYSTGPTEVPSETPTIIPTSTYSPLQLSLVTLTPTSTATLIPSPTVALAVEEPTAESEEVLEPTPTLIDLGPTATATAYTQELYETNVGYYIESLSTYIDFDLNDLKGLLENSLYEQKLKAELTKDLPHTQEQVWARHILVEDQETAEMIIDLLNNGGDFSAIAAMYSTDTGTKTNGGDLGWFNASDMVAAFSGTAFNLEVGQISDPVETEFGFHIIQVLGHEDRPLDTSAYDISVEEYFESWLETERIAADPLITNEWIDNVPTTLQIPDTWRDDLLQILATPTPTGFSEVEQPTLDPEE